MPTTLPLAGSDDVLVYSEPSASRPRPPLQRLRAGGSVAWAVLPPEGQDSWVSASVVDGTVTANSWSCWHVMIDLESGQETERTFTK